MPTAIVVGSGAGGATVAKELQGRFDVTVLEAGREFKPFTMSLAVPERLKRWGLLFDERHIRLLFPAMKVQRTKRGLVLVRGIGTGGTTTLATGNALRLDGDLRALGIDLDEEFAELGREVPVVPAPRAAWSEPTRRMFAFFEEMGLDPKPLPKMRRRQPCASCGRCVLGCPSGAKWDSREFLWEAVRRGARVVTGCRVQEVLFEDGRAAGVSAVVGGRLERFAADVVVLAAGGLGSPVILQRSGIRCEPALFVDPVLCVAAPWAEAGQDREVPMAFAADKGRYVLSPYFDHLSYFFNRDWPPGAGNIVSLMIKLADASRGVVSAAGTIEKDLGSEDTEALGAAVDVCADVLGRLGVERDAIFFGTLNAGHPGGMLPLTREDAETLRPGGLPENLYVADATLLPASLGKPPILTIMALAKKIARVIREQFAPRPEH